MTRAEQEHTRFTVSSTAYLRNLEPEDVRADTFAIHYQPLPRTNGDGSTTIGLRIPILIPTLYLAEQQQVAERVAAILNKHWDDEA